MHKQLEDVGPQGGVESRGRSSDLPSFSEAELVRRLVQHDPEAEARVEVRLRHYADQLGHRWNWWSADDCAKVVQIATDRIYAKLHTFDRSRSFWRWAFRLLQRAESSYRRKRIPFYDSKRKGCVNALKQLRAELAYVPEAGTICLDDLERIAHAAGAPWENLFLYPRGQEGLDAPLVAFLRSLDGPALPFSVAKAASKLLKAMGKFQGVVQQHIATKQPAQPGLLAGPSDFIATLLAFLKTVGLADLPDELRGMLEALRRAERAAEWQEYDTALAMIVDYIPEHVSDLAARPWFSRLRQELDDARQD